jgi:dTDP-4-amino-4,6-dideoxygalactose transaminase
LGYASSDCPNAERYYETAVTLPLFAKMTAGDVQDVVGSVRKVCREYKKEGG